MKKTKTILVLLLLLLFQFVNGQNIVVNGDFENFSSFPTGSGQWNRCIGWSNLNGVGGNQYPYASPDYYHTQGSGGVYLPTPISAGVSPYSGNAIMGFITKTTTPDFREYLSSQFSTPMIIGMRYKVSFWLTNGHTYFNFGSGSSHLGIKFTNSALHQIAHEPLGVVPQLEIPGTPWDTIWQQYTFSFIADSLYNYLAIGNFNDDQSTSSFVYEPAAVHPTNSYYFIDKIEIVENPELVITGDTTICSGDSIIVSAKNSLTYSWANSSNPNLILSQNDTLIIKPLLSSTYFVYGDDDTSSFHIHVDHPFSIDLGNDLTICEGESLLLDVSVPNATYLWQDLSTDSVYPVHQSGIYWVEVAINDCRASDDITVSVKDCEIVLEMPNFFSPDNDGINDHFNPVKMKGFLNQTISIYNRWGAMVFESTELSKGWDGKHGGNACANGTYYWIINYLTNNNESKTLKGFVLLNRK